MPVCDALTIRSAGDPGDDGGRACVERMGMMSGANFVSRLRTGHAAFEEHEGPLSIKCVMRGQEAYTVEGTRLVVDGGSYLVMNHGQRYGSVIASHNEVESFCVWFQPGFVEQVLAELRSPLERALDGPTRPRGVHVTFFERLYPHDELVTPVIRTMHRALEGGGLTRGWLDEQFHVLAARLLRAHRRTFDEVERMPAARQATRVELYRRLTRARDYLEASLADTVSLADVAAVACISPHHFLRLFKATFNETPRQYQTRRRMERARLLLEQTDLPVTRICYDLGFESLGSFSWLFRRLHGAPPSHYRHDRRAGGARIGPPDEADAGMPE